MKILLIDDHALFRDGLVLVLEGLNTDFEIFEASSYESAKLIMDEQQDIDLILLDLGLPGISYIDALIAIQQQLPHASIVALSGTEDHHMVKEILQHGARGYIPKSSSSKIILHALQLVIDGGTYIPPEILPKNTLQNTAKINIENTLNKTLTPRQHEVLLQLAEGKSNKNIASALNLSESTVRAHVAAILKSFNVSNRTQAVQYAMQKSWLKVKLD